MIQTSDLSISAGEDNAAILAEATELVNHGRWTLCKAGKGLERSFKFKSFKVTWDFMNSVASECKTARHHPEWTNVYSTTFIRWTTHNPEGLSAKDIAMARFCDATAATFNELQQPSAQQMSDAAAITDVETKIDGAECCRIKS